MYDPFPIKHVMRHLPVAIEKIAPEREKALASLAGQVRFIFDADEPMFVCRYNTITKEVEFSGGALAVLWAFSHAYVTLHEKVLPRWLADEGEVDLQEDLETRNAMALLSWALSGWLNDGGPLNWPEGLIKPIASPAKGSPENVADELALCAAAFVMHHELAHHYLGHFPVSDPGVGNLLQEKDADREAANWILGAAQEGDPRFFFKRSLGIATALLALLAKAIHGKQFAGRSHPREFDRLLHTLDAFVEPGHRMWQFVALCLKLHLDAVGIETPRVVHESPRACVECYADVLAEAERQWSGRA